MNGLGRSITGSPDDPAVLLLHGFMGSSADWQDVVEGIEDRTLCLALDLPGHGVSLGLAPDAYTIEGSAQAVVHVLDELEVERAVIVGYSMGGRLGLYQALRYPERCAGLFLESASPGLGTEEERAARRQMDEDKARRLESGDFGAFLQDWYRQPLFAPLARDGELLRRTVEARRYNNPAELARSLRGMGTGCQPSLWNELPRLRVPALALAGELDEKFVGIASRMSLVSSGVRMELVPDAGHNVRAEKPGDYLAALTGFLDRTTFRAGWG